MRERITYLQKLGDFVDPSAVRVDTAGINGPDVDAVREDRLTLALDELPAELRALLASTKHLHVRWVSTDAHHVVSPVLARLPPGFHVFFTPDNKSDSAVAAS